MTILKPFILSFEGGFANDPDDLGGATMKGVTLNTYKAWRKERGLPAPTVQDLKGITDAEWDGVFKSLFWDRWRADGIKDQSLANILVDWLWISGSYGIRIPQYALGVTVDGIVGQKTLAALNSQPPSMFFERLRQEREGYIDRICKSRPRNRKYRNGWLRRLNAIRYGSLTCATGKKVEF